LLNPFDWFDSYNLKNFLLKNNKILNLLATSVMQAG